jgi:acetyl esterase/lipase
MKVFTSPKGCVLAYCLAILGWLGNSSLAQDILIGWDFPTNSTTNSVLSSTNALGVIGPKAMTMASGLSNSISPNTNAWGGSGWTANGTTPIPNGTINNDYFAFEISSASGKKINITGVSRLVMQVSPSGPKKWSLLYAEQTNTSSFDPTPLRNYGPFDVTNPTVSGTVANSDITTQLSNAISSNPIVLGAGKTGYFRLVGFGGTSSSGTGRIVGTNVDTPPDFALTGVVEDTPKSSQSISFPAIPSKIFGDGPFTPEATASSGQAISFTSSDSAVATASGSVITITGLGTAMITANQLGNTDYFEAPAVSQTLTVSAPTRSDYLIPRYAVTSSSVLFHKTNDYKGVVTNLYADIYRKTGSFPATLQPVVLLVHGGGYNASSADRSQSYIVELGTQLASRGFQAVAIDYRLRATADRNTHEEQLPALRDAAADALSGLAYIRSHAATNNWDTNAIFILGGSAGGRIVTWLAVRESGDQQGLSTSDTLSTTSPKSSITSDATAVYDRSGLVAAAVLFGAPEPEFRAYVVGASDLPCAILHGTYDGNTLQSGSIDSYTSADLYGQLVGAGVPAELHYFNGYGHQFDYSTEAFPTGAYATVDAIPTVADTVARFFVKQWDRKLVGGTEIFAPASINAGGSSLTLTAPVTNHSAPGTTYQWKKDGVNLVGETGATLLLNPLLATDNGSYAVDVGNPDKSWLASDISWLSFVNTPISGVNFISTGLKTVPTVFSHPTSMTLSVATVNVPSFAVVYPGESATSDVDGDGWVALVEYALGWSRAQGSVGKSAIFPQTVMENQRLVLNYQVRTNDPKLVVTAETSSDLGNPLSWSSTGVSVSAVGSVTVGGEVLEKRSASVPMDVATRLLRLRILQNP